ncbi:MAG: exo-alpha-sialidase, partial [Verrucomicrobia bacterium]|nr:exo-alpha-sialidase [Verrucomicrobiota bacterium]
MKSFLELLVVFCLCAPLTALQSAETPPGHGTGHIIVPYSKEAARNGEASLIELRDGSLLLMYGAHQKSGDWDRGEIRQIRSRDGGKTWSTPETVFSDAKRSLFQISFARLANGDLGLTHTSLANGRDAFKVFRRSTDDGKTWSGPLKISDDSHEYTTGPWDKLYVLASGRVIALLHCNLKPDAKKQGGPLGAYTVYSDDHGKSWTRSPGNAVLHVPDNPLKKHEWGFWEPSLVEHAPGKLLMLGRTTTGWLWESRSEDNGSTWNQPVQSTVPNPVAPPVLTR